MIELSLTYEEAASLLHLLEFTKKNFQLVISPGSFYAIEKLIAEVDNYQQLQAMLPTAEVYGK